MMQFGEFLLGGLLGIIMGFPLILGHAMLLSRLPKWSKVTRWIIPAMVLIWLAPDLAEAFQQSLDGCVLSFYTPLWVHIGRLLVLEGLLALVTRFSRTDKAVIQA